MGKETGSKCLPFVKGTLTGQRSYNSIHRIKSHMGSWWDVDEMVFKSAAFCHNLLINSSNIEIFRGLLNDCSEWTVDES